MLLFCCSLFYLLTHSYMLLLCVYKYVQQVSRSKDYVCLAPVCVCMCMCVSACVCVLVCVSFLAHSPSHTSGTTGVTIDRRADGRISWSRPMASAAVTAFVCFLSLPTTVTGKPTAFISKLDEHIYETGLRRLCCEPVWPSGKALSPFLTGRMFVRRTYFGRFDEL